MSCLITVQIFTGRKSHSRGNQREQHAHNSLLPHLCANMESSPQTESNGSSQSTSDSEALSANCVQPILAEVATHLQLCRRLSLMPSEDQALDLRVRRKQAIADILLDQRLVTVDQDAHMLLFTSKRKLECLPEFRRSPQLAKVRRKLNFD